MKKKIGLVLVDCQVDFCDLPGSNLPVTGADADCKRIAELVKKRAKEIGMIYPTFDSHQWLHVAHPIMWIDKNGNHPMPFTTITVEDVLKGVWRPAYIPYAKRLTDYVKKLYANGRYPLTIWNPHCIIGTSGWCLHPAIAEAIRYWSETTMKPFSPITKGSNIFSEHYSAVQADVPDPEDHSTGLNEIFIGALAKNDEVWFAGEAEDFCVANTMEDIANNFGPDNIGKMRLIVDGTSRVNAPGLEHLGDDFRKRMIAKGMKIMRTTDF